MRIRREVKMKIRVRSGIISVPMRLFKRDRYY